MDSITMEDLKPNMCRWPFGDPQEDDFHFCGEKKHEGPYCDKHDNMSRNKNHKSSARLKKKS